MAQKLRKHGKKLEKTSVGCHIDFTILLSMLKVKAGDMGLIPGFSKFYGSPVQMTLDFSRTQSTKSNKPTSSNTLYSIFFLNS